MIETNKDAYGLDLKKYKLGGVARLHNALNNINLEVKSLGYETVDYEAGINKSYRLVNKSQKTKNQSIEYGSFDDANGLAGIEAPNNGFFGLVQIEEPVLIDDPGKTPTRSE
ncbi:MULTISPECIES: hypothetical protein [Actinomycetes]|uniref:Uncharacterized protein n=2 Tax=Actinomycetes TaxID=1760 RepID=A0A7K3WJQ0_9ACTN|nr:MULTISPECIES: hypothetical protein [Actinomycetes]MCS5736492.1 hypothetical protein [Herbiconiux daphne]NEL56721.1 hypothetical protein [Goekera deserti]